MTQEVHSAVKKVQSIAPITGSSSINGASADCRGFTHMGVSVMVGVITATNTCTVKLQDSADDSTFADITGAAVTTVDATDDGTVIPCALKLEPNAINRYVRAVATIATANIALGVQLELMGSYSPPAESATLGFDV